MHVLHRVVLLVAAVHAQQSQGQNHVIMTVQTGIILVVIIVIIILGARLHVAVTAIPPIRIHILAIKFYLCFGIGALFNIAPFFYASADAQTAPKLK